MNSRDYLEHNERFDKRFQALRRAGFKCVELSRDEFSPKVAALYGNVGISKFVVTHSEIMWKPLGAFELYLQNILGE